MTVITSTGAIFVGSKIVIPEPQEDDSWYESMITEVEDILDNDTVIFADDEYDLHEIDKERIQLYKGK